MTMNSQALEVLNELLSDLDLLTKEALRRGHLNRCDELIQERMKVLTSAPGLLHEAYEYDRQSKPPERNPLKDPLPSSPAGKKNELRRHLMLGETDAKHRRSPSATHCCCLDETSQETRDDVTLSHADLYYLDNV